MTHYSFSSFTGDTKSMTLLEEEDLPPFPLFVPELLEEDELPLLPPFPLFVPELLDEEELPLLPPFPLLVPELLEEEELPLLPPFPLPSDILGRLLEGGTSVLKSSREEDCDLDLVPRAGLSWAAGFRE